MCYVSVSVSVGGWVGVGRYGWVGVGVGGCVCMHVYVSCCSCIKKDITVSQFLIQKDPYSIPRLPAEVVIQVTGPKKNL